MVAGRSKSVLSSRKRRWRVPAAARTLVDFSAIVPVERAILLILVRHLPADLDGELLRVSSLEHSSRLIASWLWDFEKFQIRRRVRLERSTTIRSDTSAATPSA